MRHTWILALIIVIGSLNFAQLSSGQDENSAPVANLITPIDGSGIHNPRPTLEWSVQDADGDKVVVDLYVTSMPAMFWPSFPTLIAKNLMQTNYTLTENLRPGTYEWTVIPKDGKTTGICADCDWTFSIDRNIPPKTMPFPIINISIGDQLRFNFEVTDLDPEDQTGLAFELEDPPEGATIEHDTGLFSWAPNETQIGTHVMNLTVSDPYSMVKEELTINVEPEQKEKTEPERLDYLPMSGILISLIVSSIHVYYSRGKNVK